MSTNYLRRDKYRKRKPKPISEMLKKDFSPKNMGEGLKRGYVLRIYKNELKKLTGNTKWANDIDREWISEDESNNMFIIYFKSGTVWANALQQFRYQLKQAINKRCKSNFIKEVRFK